MYDISAIPVKDYQQFNRLQRLHKPPQKLFYQGDMTVLDMPTLAIIGSRKASSYGRDVCAEIIRQLAPYQVTIISGLALGIDSIAHKEALRRGLKTAAILPSGLNSIYPASHQHLAKKILETNGLLISEYEPDRKAARYLFPERNRIIAGLADALIVIEAAAKSGTMTTSAFALDAGVPILAVPGSIFSINSAGTHNLIANGARIYRDIDDLLEELQLEKRGGEDPLAYDELESEIIRVLKKGELPFSKLADILGKKPETLLPKLSLMELRDSVVNIGNNTWRLKR